MTQDPGQDDVRRLLDVDPRRHRIGGVVRPDVSLLKEPENVARDRGVLPVVAGEDENGGVGIPGEGLCDRVGG